MHFGQTHKVQTPGKECDFADDQQAPQYLQQWFLRYESAANADTAGGENKREYGKEKETYKYNLRDRNGFGQMLGYRILSGKEKRGDNQRDYTFNGIVGILG